MNNTIVKLLIFAGGSVFGSAVTKIYFADNPRKCPLISSITGSENNDFLIEEIRRLMEKVEQLTREYNKDNENGQFFEEENNRFGQNDISEAEDICENAGYAQNDDEREEGDSMEEPYVIPPEEFGENEWTESLIYYADGVLAKEDGTIIDDVDALVGDDFYTHFGEYEDDSVFVRNDQMRTDFEILMDSRTYDKALLSTAFEMKGYR